MPLVLTLVLFFIVVGLASTRFDWRQQSLIALAAIGIALVQYTFPRFL
jgi:hypothetical protein